MNKVMEVRGVSNASKCWKSEKWDNAIFQAISHVNAELWVL